MASESPIPALSTLRQQNESELADIVFVPLYISLVNTPLLATIPSGQRTRCDHRGAE